MASPQIENGHVKIASEIVEQLARVNLRPYEWRVLLFVLRKTYGWNKKMDTISVSQIVKGTGLHKQHASNTRKTLLEKRLLIKKDGKIGLNKNYDQWLVKVAKVTDSGDGVTETGDEEVTDSGAKVTDSGYKTSPKQVPQKHKALNNSSSAGEVSNSFREYWNSKTNLPSIVSITHSRKKKLAARMKEPGFADNWQEVIDRISASGFCTRTGRASWRASILDWLLSNSTNCVKVLEGKYDDSSPPKTVVPLERDADGLTPRQRELKRIGAM